MKFFLIYFLCLLEVICHFPEIKALFTWDLKEKNFVFIWTDCSEPQYKNNF